MGADRLLQEFPPVSTEAWEEVIARDLKGADYTKKLVWQSDDGFAVRPYYRAEDLVGLEYLDAPPGSFPYVRGTRPTGNWRIRQDVDAVDPIPANQAACSAVVAGAEEIAFRNVQIANASDLANLLTNLREIPVHFPNAKEALLRLLVASELSASVSTGWDPFTNLDLAAEIAATAAPTFAPFTIHGDELEESGATTVQEVGFTLAAGIDFVAEMQSRKLDISRAASALVFSFAMGSNYFFQMAKLRAFRLLWARAVESFGGSRESAKARIHARTSRWNETIYDPHVNVLRGTTEAMSAAFGGADSISVAPFDECYKTPDEASRRLARNTQILLKQESLLGQVADPGGGSYALEMITDFLAREGWKTMQSIESVGGYQKAQADGLIAPALDKSLAGREKAVELRRRIFTGTTQHANLNEKALDRIDVSGPTGKRRGTEAYEELRLRTERHVAAGGKNARVLLAEIGDVKMRAARSNFAANFFGCAGFDIVTRHFDNIDEVAAADADIVVLCSSDPEYLALATALIAKRKALGRTVPVVVAGYPESAEQMQAAGVADFIHIKSNPIEVLTKWQEQLGIKS
ncbi:MAG: methylmalonyl-CoA mutase family protein [Terriglobales bacterium]|jgi:methylmalonyl-CoA mutase